MDIQLGLCPSPDTSCLRATSPQSQLLLQTRLGSQPFPQALVAKKNRYKQPRGCGKPSDQTLERSTPTDPGVACSAANVPAQPVPPRHGVWPTWETLPSLLLSLHCPSSAPALPNSHPGSSPKLGGCACVPTVGAAGNNHFLSRPCWKREALFPLTKDAVWSPWVSVYWPLMSILSLSRQRARHSPTSGPGSTPHLHRTAFLPACWPQTLNPMRNKASTLPTHLRGNWGRAATSPHGGQAEGTRG